jgi:NDP-hexose 4-ketoreductase
MRVLIIGASSYLGGHVLRQASAAGHTVVTAGRSAVPESPSHRRLDLAADDPSRIGAVIMSVAPDAIVNCAGATAGTADELAAANITTVYALVTAMIRSGTRARLVHIGSAAEYGHITRGMPVTESTQARPAGMYGATKLAGTRLVEVARMAGLDAVVLRVFNVVGAGAPDDGLPGRAAARVREALDTGTDVRLGPLDAVRDFVDARDVADAVLVAAAAPALPHAVLNIGSGNGVQARALVRELLAISGCSATVREDALGSVRSADLPWQQADITRAEQDLGWRPCRDLTESVADLWEAIGAASRR